jgi:hypothetical protein
VELERAVCLTGEVVHLVRPGEGRAVCGTGPLLPLAAMEEWNETWRRQVDAYPLCVGCQRGADDDSA